jgi:hypothetical protein
MKINGISYPFPYPESFTFLPKDRLNVEWLRVAESCSTKKGCAPEPLRVNSPTPAPRRPFVVITEKV